MFNSEQFDPEQLVHFGWTESVAERFSPFLTSDTIPGRIVRVDRGECDAVTATGNRRVRAGGRRLATGDWVVLDASPAAAELTAVIEVIARRGVIQRAAASAEAVPQVLAANVDTVLVVCAATGELDLGRIERMLALAWEAGAQPIVVLTKSDIAQDIAGALGQVRAIAPGAPVLAVSATTGDGVVDLRALLAGTVVLIGVSGAGKSTLTNALLGTNVMPTAQVRAVDGKGRHTTVHRELFPLTGGCTLIDTPGLRGIGIWAAEDGIAATFSEIESLAHACRFRDCTHDQEPGCAVRAAIDDGTIAGRRLDNYHKLHRENDWIAARSDARLRSERTRGYKQQAKALRRHYRNRGY